MEFTTVTQLRTYTNALLPYIKVLWCTEVYVCSGVHVVIDCDLCCFILLLFHYPIILTLGPGILASLHNLSTWWKFGKFSPRRFVKLGDLAGFSDAGIKGLNDSCFVWCLNSFLHILFLLLLWYYCMLHYFVVINIVLLLLLGRHANITQVFYRNWKHHFSSKFNLQPSFFAKS